MQPSQEETNSPRPTLSRWWSPFSSLRCCSILEDATFSFTIATSSTSGPSVAKTVRRIVSSVGESFFFFFFFDSEWDIVSTSSTKTIALDSSACTLKHFCLPVSADNDLVKEAWPVHFGPDNTFLFTLFLLRSLDRRCDCFVASRASRLCQFLLTFSPPNGPPDGCQLTRVQVSLQLWETLGYFVRNFRCASLFDTICNYYSE